MLTEDNGVRWDNNISHMFTGMDGNGAIPAGERADVLLPDSGKMAHPHPRPRSRGGFFPVPVPVRGSGTRRVPRPRNIPDDSRGEGAGRLPREAELGGGLQGGRRPAAREAELGGGLAAARLGGGDSPAWA